MQKTDIEDIYKKEEGVFVNTSLDKLTAYKIRRQKQRELDESKKKVDEMDKRIDHLQSSIDELKDLLIKGLK